MVSPGASSVPANRLPIITQEAPAAMALVMSPENLIPPSAMIGARGFHDGGNLRNAGAGDYARGANGAGPHPDLQSINAERNEILRAFVGGYVAGDELHVRQAVADGFDGVHDAGGMAVRRVDGNDVGLALRHFHGPLQKIAGGADGRADAQPALLVLRGARIFAFLLNVFHGDQALEIEIAIHDQKLFDAMLLQDAFGFVER